MLRPIGLGSLRPIGSRNCSEPALGFSTGTLHGSARSALPCKGPRANLNAGERAMEGLRPCIGRLRSSRSLHLTLGFLGFRVLRPIGLGTLRPINLGARPPLHGKVYYLTCPLRALPCKGPRANPNAGERAMEELRPCIGRFSRSQRPPT